MEYRYTTGQGTIRIGLRPGIQFRNHDAQTDPQTESAYSLEMRDHRLEVKSGTETAVLRLKTDPRAAFTYDPKMVPITYPIERHRGYPYQGSVVEPRLFSHRSRTGGIDRFGSVDGAVGGDRGARLRRRAGRRNWARRRSLIECAGGNDNRMQARNWRLPPTSS